MSTRSYIGIEMRGGQVRYVYCHFDGYAKGPHGVGHKLLTYWVEREQVEAMIDLGELSVLGQEIGERHKFGVEATPGWNVHYGREMGGGRNEARFASLSEFWSLDEYCYLLKLDGSWEGKTPFGQPVPLVQLTAQEATNAA